MLIRLLSPLVLLALSLPAVADISTVASKQQKDQFKCDEQLAAKHFALRIELTWMSLMNSRLGDQMIAYQSAMENEKTCAGFANGYKILVDIATSHNLDAEKYFAGPDAKVALKQIVDTFREINKDRSGHFKNHR